MSKTIIRIICLISVSFGIYKTDLESVMAFISLMTIVFWAVPEVCMFIAQQSKEDSHENQSY